jgi:hypothetical protein
VPRHRTSKGGSPGSPSAIVPAGIPPVPAGSGLVEVRLAQSHWHAGVRCAPGTSLRVRPDTARVMAGFGVLADGEIESTHDPEP